MSGETTTDLTVLHAIKAPGADTTYASHMNDPAPPELEVLFFSWDRALTARYDVLHLHWPEYLVRGRGKRDAARSFLRMPRLLRKIRRDRIAVVRTLHNPAPHERGYWFEGFFLGLLDARVTRYITLNPVDVGPDTEVILHGDYIERFAQHPRSEPVPGRILYFGLVRPYKGIDLLIDAFDDLDAEQYSLRVVGRPNSPAMRELVQSAVDARPDRTSARLEFVSDEALVAEVTAAELTVLPYREMHNSGSLLVSLSLGVPVLAIDSPVNRAIRDEIGDGWIWLYDGDLTAEVIRETIVGVRSSTRAATPAFDHRDWAMVAAKHMQVYRDAVAQVRGPAQT